MSVIYRRAAVRGAAPVVEVEAARPAHPAVSGMKGAFAGAATGLAVAVGGSAVMPGVGLAVFVAMGVLFGAFNGGLLGVITHRDNRF
ncbi:MAG: hypothetical protein M3003_15735 [Candidatus Dormibacteraeota bacterium]|nr:hypothetical protein [Candidatus Dormibacteraeota bacterium]